MSVYFHQLFRRRPELSPREFAARFEAYARDFDELQRALGASGVHFAQEWGHAVNDQIAVLRGTQAPYDGIVRMRLQQPDLAVSRLQLPEVRDLIARLQQTQATFADMERSTVFLTESIDLV